MQAFMISGYMGLPVDSDFFHYPDREAHVTAKWEASKFAGNADGVTKEDIRDSFTYMKAFW